MSLYSLSTASPFPLGVLTAGIFLLATSVTLFMVQLFRAGPELPRTQRNLHTFYLLGLSLTISFTRLSRYAGFNGFDLIAEGSVLQHTLSAGFWDPRLGDVSNYQSSLAITILPTLTAGTIGVPGLTVFLFQTFFLTALLPMAVHPIINRLTGNFKLATFSSLLFVQNWFFYGQHLIGKTAPALFLGVLAFYCLTQYRRSFQSLGVLLSLGVVMSHYTIALFELFLLFSYLAISGIIVPVFNRLSPLRITPSRTRLAPIAASVTLIIAWLALAAPLILPSAVSSVEQSLSSISQLASGQGRPGLSLATSSPAGPIVTGWFDLQNLLVGLGGLYMLYQYRRGLIRENLATWTLAGLALIILLVAWTVLPVLSVSVEPTRILQMALPFTIIFLGVLLLRIARPSSKLALAAVITLLLLMLPMNLMIANQERNPLYHTADSLPLDKRVDDDSSLIPSYSNYAVIIWANNYLPSDKPVGVDSLGRYAFITSLPFPPRLNFSQEILPPYCFNRYSILSSYFVDDHIWTATILGSSVQVPGQLPSPFFSPTHNVLYSSTKFWVMSPARCP